MNKRLVAVFLMLFFLAACTGAGGVDPTVQPPAAPASETPTALPLPSETPTLAPTSTPSYPPAGLGPASFPAGINPITGLEVADPALLERRPLAVKISNLPRYVRPQWGLSVADLVFEYYTEQGSTRFIAVFYGQDAEIAGPIRSARFFDVNIIRGYKAVFAYGSADVYYNNTLYNSEFVNRLVLEWSPDSPLIRYDPSGYNHLVVDTAKLSAYITGKGVSNSRQDLDGMFFQMNVPAGGQDAGMVFVRYSSAIFNRWDYDPASGKYQRYAESGDDFSGTGEQYILQTDRLTGNTLAFDNMVVLVVPHLYKEAEIWDIQLVGGGTAYAFRDGQMFQVRWQRPAPEGVVTLLNADGTPFPFKPGTTWFEVIGTLSEMKQTGSTVRFIHMMP